MVNELEPCCVLPCSANWFGSALCDFGPNSLIAFASKNRVTLFDADKKRVVCTNAMVHNSRVIAVAFAKNTRTTSNGSSPLVFTATADGVVRLWDAFEVCGKEKSLAKHNHHAHEATCACASVVEQNDNDNKVVFDCVVTADKRGNVVCWGVSHADQIKTKVFGTLSLENPREHVVCVACVPLESRQVVTVVAGTNLGNILLIQFDCGDTSPKCATATCGSMEGPIFSVSCSQFSREDPNGSGCAVISGVGKDENVMIWKVDTASLETSLIHSFRCPKDRGYQQNNSNARKWITATLIPALITPTQITLVVSSATGSLSQYKFNPDADTAKDNNNQNQRQKSKSLFPLFRENPTRAVFTVAVESTSSRFVCVSLDRHVGVYDSKSLTCEWRVQGLGGYVYSLAVSSVNATNKSSVTCVGTGDNTLRLWTQSFDEQSAQHSCSYNTHLIWRNIDNKVTATCWCPALSAFAFATGGGAAGLCEAHAQHKVVCQALGSAAIYSLACVESPTHSVIFACGADGSIHHVALEAKKLDFDQNQNAKLPWKNTNTLISQATDPCGISQLVSSTHPCEVCWNSADLLFVGFANGCVVAFKMVWNGCDDLLTFELVAVIQGHTTAINRLCCTYCSETATTSVAAAATDGTVCIAKISQQVLNDAVTEGIMQFSTVLAAHSASVTGVAWHPYLKNLFVTCSFDGSARIWHWDDTLQSATLINVLKGHIGRIFCVAWDPTGRFVITGSEDQTAIAWDAKIPQNIIPPISIIDNTLQHPTKHQPVRHQGPQQQTGQSPALPQLATTQTLAVEPEHNPHAQHNHQQVQQHQQQQQSSTSATPPQPQQQPSTSATTPQQQPQQQPSTSAITPQQQPQQQQQQPVELAAATHTKLAVESVDNQPRVTKPQNVKSKKATLFPQYESKQVSSSNPNAPDLMALLGSPPKCGEGTGDWRQLHCGDNCASWLSEQAKISDSNGVLSIWTQDLALAIDAAIQEGKLTVTLVALSASLGPDVWRSCCSAYGHQLHAAGDLHAASKFFVTCGAVREAIDMYLQHQMFREANALASTYLTKTDTQRVQVLCAWARLLETEGNFKQAAACYLSVGKLSSAIVTLTHQGDEESIQLATSLKQELDATQSSTD